MLIMVNKQQMDNMAKDIAKKVLEGELEISDVLNRVNSENSEIIYNSNALALRFLSDWKPEMIYPHWDFFVDMIRKDNNYLKMNGIYTIANLTKVDKEEKFEKIFDEFYKLLDCESLMIANHLAGLSGTIAKAKPDMQNNITKNLLKIDETHFDPQRKDLIKGYAIEAFNEYFDEIENRNDIIEFVKKLTKSKSSTTSKKAKGFLKKRGLS